MDHETFPFTCIMSALLNYYKIIYCALQSNTSGVFCFCYYGLLLLEKFMLGGYF